MIRAPRHAAFGLALFLGPASLALAQPSYPSKPITIVIGYTPGAVSDLAARTIADGLHQAWGQPVIVDNRPGSGGNIGAAYVARAPADGYTLMVGTDATMASNVHFYRHVGFDPVKDFAPVAYAGANIICLAVNAEPGRGGDHPLLNEGFEAFFVIPQLDDANAGAPLHRGCQVDVDVGRRFVFHAHRANDRIVLVRGQSDDVEHRDPGLVFVHGPQNLGRAPISG